MNTYKIYYADGNTVITGFNGDLKDAQLYYLGNYFNFGDIEGEDRMVKCINVEEIK